jgi:hypothetical protein
LSLAPESNRSLAVIAVGSFLEPAPIWRTRELKVK